MSLRKAAEMALGALENPKVDLRGMAQAMTALRQALAQPVKSYCGGKPNYCTEPEDWVKQELLGGEWVPCVKLPVVVHVRNQRDGETHISTREGITPVLPEDLIMRGVAGEEYPIGRELFERTYTFDTAPPKREWVGLTDEEIHEIVSKKWWDWEDAFDIEGFSRAIEAKLKDKNT